MKKRVLMDAPYLHQQAIIDSLPLARLSIPGPKDWMTEDRESSGVWNWEGKNSGWSMAVHNGIQCKLSVFVVSINLTEI